MDFVMVTPYGRIMSAESGSGGAETFEELFPGAGGQVDKYYRSRSSNGPGGGGGAGTGSYGASGGSFATNLFDVQGNMFLSNGETSGSMISGTNEYSFAGASLLTTVSGETIAPFDEAFSWAPLLLSDYLVGPAVIGDSDGSDKGEKVKKDRSVIRLNFNAFIDKTRGGDDKMVSLVDFYVRRDLQADNRRAFQDGSSELASQLRINPAKIGRTEKREAERAKSIPWATVRAHRWLDQDHITTLNIDKCSSLYEVTASQFVFGNTSTVDGSPARKLARAASAQMYFRATWYLEYVDAETVAVTINGTHTQFPDFDAYVDSGAQKERAKLYKFGYKHVRARDWTKGSILKEKRETLRSSTKKVKVPKQTRCPKK